MTRYVFCRKYQAELPALDFLPFPGPKGQAVFDSVSKQAWTEWLQHQTKLINENHLSVMDPSTRIYLDEQREKFLSGETVDQAEGWTPPTI